MFTGIVERSVALTRVSDADGKRRLQFDSPWTDAAHGESIAINGVCLTIANDPQERDFCESRSASAISSLTQRQASLCFDVIRETLDHTNLGGLRAGDLVHVERAMKIGDRFDGHLVQGHVDGVATIVKQVADPLDWRLVGKMPDGLTKYLVPKGSICVDGVSMTLAKVSGPFFELAIIPTTLQLTQLGRRAVGDQVNVECDVLAKTIVAFLEQKQAGVVGSVGRFWE